MGSDDGGGPACVEFAAYLVTTELRPTVVVLGEIDQATVGRFSAVLDAALAIGPCIEVDLSQTTFMDSTGVRALIAAQSRPGQPPDAIVLRDPSPGVRRLIELVGLASLFADPSVAT
jgi:anti-sigma B factor antagonist